MLTMAFGMTALLVPQTSEAAKTKSAKKSTKKNSKVKSVKLKAPYAKKVYVAKGKSVKVTANQKVTFKSKNKKIATVTGKGVIKGKKVGKTKVVVVSKKNKKKKATLTVQVMKKAVKKVKLTPGQATVSVGDVLNMKAKVSAKKGASKRVYWKSSKTSVATVSQKGVVRTKKEGTAKITVQATDGSGKKATCKLTVKKASPVPVPDTSKINLTGMIVRNTKSLTFSLDKPCQLGIDSIIVKKKVYKNGTYNYTVKLDIIQTADMMNYTVSFEETIGADEYVQLTIPGLSGVNVMEGRIQEPLVGYTDEEALHGTLGQEFVGYVGRWEEKQGFASYTVTGLPAGLKYTTYDDGQTCVRVYGTPTQAGEFVATVSAVDEFGNTYTCKYRICIGSEDVVVASSQDSYNVISSSGNTFFEKSVYATGGSNTYIYELLTHTSIFSIDSNGNITGKVTEPGDYVVKVKVSDAANPAVFTTLDITFHAIKALKVRGVVTDGEGKPAGNASARVEFIAKDKASHYMNNLIADYANSTDGSYEVYVPAGTYDIEISSDAGATTYVYDCSITADTDNLNFSLPIYEVKLISNDDRIGFGGCTWKNAEDEYIGSGSKFYVKPGTYSIFTYSIGCLNDKEIATANFTITNASKEVIAQVQYIPGDASQVPVVTTPGTVLVQTGTDKYGFISFVPTETATYRIYSAVSQGDSSIDTYGVLYDSSQMFMMSVDDMKDSRQFLLEKELTAGKTYYIGARYYSWCSGTIPVVIEKVVG